MPTGSHRFGCGEIATGFKPSGYPPGFFNHPRIVPKPGGGGGSTGGGGGSSGNKFECYTETFTCESRYPNAGFVGTIVEPFCREAPGGCIVNGETCFNSSTECASELAVAVENSPCPRIDTCQAPASEYWACVETQEVCPGFHYQAGPYRYTRVCQQVAAGAGQYNSQAACIAGNCVDEDNCPDPEEELPADITPGTTGTSVVRFSCVTGDTVFCNYPCGTTAGGSCFEPTETHSKTCVQCTNCIETLANGVSVVTCDAPPAGGGPCEHLAGTNCGGGCDPEPPCPTMEQKKYCNNSSTTDCHTIWASVDPGYFPHPCGTTGTCFQTDRVCEDCISWTTGGQTCNCVDAVGSLVASCQETCISEGPGANCVTEFCPTLQKDPPPPMQ